MDIARQIAHAQNMNEGPQDEVMLTKAQVKALIRKWRLEGGQDRDCGFEPFLDSVQPTIGCDGAVTVPWCGMWLCIEKDGYTHS